MTEDGDGELELLVLILAVYYRLALRSLDHSLINGPAAASENPFNAHSRCFCNAHLASRACRALLCCRMLYIDKVTVPPT